MRLLFFMLLLSSVAAGQSVGYLRYDTVKVMKQGGVSVLKIEGAFQPSSTLSLATTGNMPAIGQSFQLDTISSDQTVTFTALENGRVGTVMFVENVNSSAFVWNVSGPVIEGSTGETITFLTRGSHIFRWNGSYWNHTGGSGGSTPETDSVKAVYPLYFSGPREMSLDPAGLPEDTSFVALHGTTLWNVLYRYDGVRDSTVIGDVNTEGGTDTIVLQPVGASGFEILEGSNDTIYFKKIRDSLDMNIIEAPDGALVYYVDVPDAALTSTHVGYGSVGNTITSEAAFTYDATNNQLNVDTVNATKGAFGGYTFINPITGVRVGIKAGSTSSSNYALHISKSTDNSTMFAVRDDGVIDGTNWVSSASNFRQKGTTGNWLVTNVATTSGNLHQFNGNTNIGNAGGLVAIVAAGLTFAPTSSLHGFAMFRANSAINQTGTANGPIYGFSYDPQITAIIGKEYAFYSNGRGTVNAAGFEAAITAKTAAYTATNSDHTITCDATSAAFTVTLPAAASYSGKILVIKKTDASANAITVDGNASETIDGAATYSLATQYKYVQIQSNGTNWFVIGNN